MLFLFLNPLALLLEGLALALVVGFIALAAPRLLGGEPRSLSGLRLSMVATSLAVVLGSVGVLYLVVQVLQTGLMTLEGVVLLVLAFMIIQWLVSPYLINLAYRVREPGPGEEWLVWEAERLAQASGLKPPKVVVAEVGIPNAFAYGSPLTGNYVAVTRGLLRLLPREEVVAVLGHEVGHLKHRDVAVILALGLLPTAIYFLGRMFLYWAWWGSWGGARERDSSPLVILAIGMLLIVAGFLFHFLVTHFSRLREYFADANSARVTGEPRLLQRALARLHLAYRDERVREELSKHSVASTLFIVNYLLDMYGSMFYQPGWAMAAYGGDIDSIVESLKRQEESSLRELFSTHPPISKRLRFLDRIRADLWS